MKDLLVGSTGFVGGNLKRSHDFFAVCHSTDVIYYYSSHPELCIYAGVPSTMFLANSNPDADLEFMKKARKNIRNINPKKVVLISTIAVFSDCKGKDENSGITFEGLTAYGKNRLLLESWTREDWPDALIIRLPALYGIGLKKNFLYDLHQITPSMLTPERFEEFSRKSKLVKEGYTLMTNGFYCLHKKADVLGLEIFFENNDFNALSFTDSRSRYQFYNLNRLWNDILIGIKYALKTLNLCTHPVSAQEVYEYVTGKCDWVNELNIEPYNYDIRSIYANKFGGCNGYLCNKERELADIKKFMDEWKE